MASRISFSELQLRAPYRPGTAPDPVTTTHVDAGTTLGRRAVAAIVGDGDSTLETGETGHVLAAARTALGSVKNMVTLNGAGDPVKISAHGWSGTAKAGALKSDKVLNFEGDTGFGMQRTARALDSGNSLTWSLNDMDGKAQHLDAVSFTVSTGEVSVPTVIGLDFDGDVIASGTYRRRAPATADVALNLDVRGGDVVRIDFEAKSLTVNGDLRDGDAVNAFFGAYEAGPQNAITIGGMGPLDTRITDLVLDRSDAISNEPPTVSNGPPAVSLTQVLAGLPENADVGARIKVADIAVTDDGIGSNALQLSGADADLFEIVGTELFLKAGATLDFEGNPRLDVAVSVDDPALGAPGTAEASAGLALDIGNVAESWGAITLDGALTEWGAATRLATGGDFTLHGDRQGDAFLFALTSTGTPVGPNTTIWLNTDLDTATGHLVFGTSAGAEYNINFGADGRPALYRGGAGEIFVADLDYVFNAGRTTVEIALPAGLVGGAALMEIYADVNDAVFLPDVFTKGLTFGQNSAPAVSLTQVLAGLPENADVGARIKVADIAVTDDGIGSNALQLSGADADLFEIVGTELFLKAGATLDFEGNPRLDVAVSVDDPALGAPGTAEASAGLALDIGNVAESWGAITLDGTLTEWGAATRLATGGDFTLHGDRQGDAFLFALTSTGTPVGPNTTIWLNTDLDTATGHLVFGTSAGAEYNINFGADGRPALYRGGAGEIFVADLDYVFNAGRTTVEIALPAGLVGGAALMEIYADVNDAVFLPDVFTKGLTFGQNSAPAVSLTQVLAGLPENADVGARIKVADIAVTDDGIGSNALQLSGADADLFEIVGTELFLKAGATLDFEGNPRLDVAVSVDDPALGAPGTAEASAGLALDIGNVAESWGAITLDGAIADWSAATILATRTEGGASYTLRGAYDAGAFLVSMESDGAPVGPNTTIWLNTDLNALTGHREFGTGPGAEFHIDFGADGAPALYMGTLRQTFVANLDYTYNADRTTVEIALPANLVGGATRLELYGDVANSVFFPNPYGTGYTIGQNSAPAVSLTQVLAGLPENADVGARIKVADIAVTDDGIGSNALQLSGADADLFEIVGTELFLKAGATLDFEGNPRLDVAVSVDDPALGAPGTAEASAGLALDIGNVAESWGAITLDGAIADWSAATILATRTEGGASYTLRGAYDAGAFLVSMESDGAPVGPNTTIWLNTDLNALTGHREFGTGPGAEFHIDFGADGAPALYMGTLRQTFVANLDYTYNADRTTVEIALPANLVGGATRLELYGDVANSVFFPNPYGTGYTIGQNSAPAVSLTQVLAGLPENADVGARIKVADIAVTDDGIGSNALQLSGADADLFEIVGTELFLKAGATLDFEGNPRLDVAVSVDDPALGAPGTAEASAGLALDIGNVAESWGAITLDGAIADWSAATILATRTEGGASYTLRGAYDAGAFLVSMESDGAPVGPNTTIWLNTDLNALTGHREFGTGPGAEFHIDFGADGAPALYTGTLRQTFVANLDYTYNADRTTVEIALPANLVGGATRLELYGDITNSVFFPNPYGTGYTIGQKPPLQPVDSTERIAIVYSATTAEHYFDKTAYGQLFMAAQHQAMQAGLPYDVISETDLTDISKLAGYDSIVFPGLSHVPAALLSDITNTLTTASQDYGIGLVAMGNFLSNDETGAAIAGDSYARMKTLLGVTLDSFGTTSGVQIRAETGGHPVSDRYVANELVGTYNNNSYLTFRDVSGNGQTLFTQTTADGELPAVITTNTGGRNVHFASDAVFGNTNILQEAIKWSSLGDTPEAALKMTRGESLFFSRNDMDQSQEIFDVVDQNPGIYDEMLPIIEKWYADYGFVGSYYVNVGADPAEFQATDWSVSRPYYQRILALESEIGTHSYTHPHDTNLLLPDVITAEVRAQKIVTNPELQPLVSGLSLAQLNQQMAAALAATNPSAANPVLPSSLSPVQRALLEFSARFQFDYSRQIIERELGLDNLGAAVPGAPEKIDASFAILQHVDYLTGGYSGIGAGYPGAFGFLDPDHADKVYFAPNVSFDFSLIEFQKLSAAQAEAKWNAEFEQITAKGSTPIIHFPWHDYGPTNWITTPGANSGYTEAMFTNFIARAYRSGTEFVTGEDLADRIETFVGSDLEIEETANGLRATVSGSDLGSFSLETGSKIASVANWYAYNDDRVFLDSNGGVFDVTFGAQASDVTHLVSLPMRTELVSVSGDGSDLTFSFDGRGAFGVALKSLGANSVVTTGATGGSSDGNVLTLRTDATGRQTMAVDYRDGTEITGTAGANVVVLSDDGRRVDGGGGNDTLIAGAGSDTFVFRLGTAADTVLKFDLAEDRIDISAFGYESAAVALGSFTQSEDGAILSFSDAGSLLLADIRADDLRQSNLILGDSLLA